MSGTATHSIPWFPIILSYSFRRQWAPQNLLREEDERTATDVPFVRGQSAHMRKLDSGVTSNIHLSERTSLWMPLSVLEVLEKYIDSSCHYQDVLIHRNSDCRLCCMRWIWFCKWSRIHDHATIKEFHRCRYFSLEWWYFLVVVPWIVWRSEWTMHPAPQCREIVVGYRYVCFISVT